MAANCGLRLQKNYTGTIFFGERAKRYRGRPQPKLDQI